MVFAMLKSNKKIFKKKSTNITANEEKNINACFLSISARFLLNKFPFEEFGTLHYLPVTPGQHLPAALHDPGHPGVDVDQADHLPVLGAHLGPLARPGSGLLQGTQGEEGQSLTCSR